MLRQPVVLSIAAVERIGANIRFREHQPLGISSKAISLQGRWNWRDTSRCAHALISIGTERRQFLTPVKG